MPSTNTVSTFGGTPTATGLSVISATTISSTDPNYTTFSRGCGNTCFLLCHEVKDRNLLCLHVVMDYFELVGMDFATQLRIQNAFTITFTSAVEKDMLEANHQFTNKVEKSNSQIVLKMERCGMPCSTIFVILAVCSSFLVWPKGFMIS